MAASIPKRKRCDFRLPLKMSSKMLQELQPECWNAVYEAFAEDLPLLNKRFHAIERIPYITIRKISYLNEQIIFTFDVETEEELDQFYRACKAKTLSDILSDFADSCGIGIRANLKANDSLVLLMDMERSEYFRLKSLLCKIESGESFENSNMASAVTRTVVHTSTESHLPSKEVGLTNKAPDVKMCGFDFYLHLLVEKENVLYVKLLSSSCKELDQIELEAVPGHDGLWSVHVEVPTSNLKHDISYKYKIKVRKPVLLIFESTTTSESALKPLRWTVHRDDIGALTLEGYLAHCLHIFTISKRIDVFDCMKQLELERLSLPPDCTFAQKHALVEILKSSVSLSNRSSTVLFTIMLINIFQSCIREFLDTNIITKEMMRAILQKFKGENPVNYSELHRSDLLQLLVSFCMFHYGTDYCLLVFIYEIYPFFDERFFSNKIVDLISSKSSLCSADLANFEFIREILTVAGHRIGPDTEPDVVAFLERLLRHLPLSLALQGYSYFCEFSFLPSEESCTKIQEKLLSTVQASSVANISKNIKLGKITHLVELWDLVKVEHNLAKCLTDRLQKDLVTFSTNITVKLSVDDSKSLHKLFLDSHLFHDEQSQELLLKAVGHSKVKNLHKLFINVLCGSKFSDCLLRNPKLLLEWLETAIKCHLKDEIYSSKEDEICPCYEYLHDALAVPVVQQDGQLCRKLEERVLNWLSKLDVKQVLRKLEDIEKLDEHKSMILDLYQRHVQQLLEDQYESSRPEDILIAVCGTRGKLLVSLRNTSQIVQKMMELYCCTFENDQFENFINMTKISKFWMVLLNMEGTQSVSAKNHDVFKKGMMCLKFILEALESSNITCSYVEKISKAQDAKELLLAATDKKTKTDIEKLWKCALSALQRENEKMACVLDVLHKVREAIPRNNLPTRWENFEEHIKDIDKSLKGGTLSTGYVMDHAQIWSYCLNLPQICEKLIGYIDSQVFWNACLHILSDKPELVDQNEPFAEEVASGNVPVGGEEELRILESLKYLFCESDQESDSFTNCVHFLELLVKHGGLKYRKDWMIFCKDQDVPMTRVVKMFEKANILEEINLQEKNVQLPVENHKRNALTLYHDFDKYHHQVEAIKLALGALDIALSSDPAFFDAVNSFEKLMTCSDIGEITLEQVYEALRTIAKIASDLNDERLPVLWALGESSSLINFLKEVADVDFRNLIDAVEEVSEQSVNEATVSGLIDIKRFLQPVLTKDMKSDIAHLFQIISKQMRDIKPNELVGKIIDCRDHVHNLRSLYNNVANRGIRTREIIDSVIKSGTFCFQLDSGDDCVLTVGYQHGKKHGHHGIDTLIDMRSRALLLMNTEIKAETSETIKRKENLEKFVLYVDIALEIGQLLTNLHISGNFKYKLYEEKMKASGLKSLKEDLDMEYSNWCARLEECRQKHYWMNFIFGQQLHVIHDFLEAGKDKDRVLSMLQFIHPDVQIEGMKEYYVKLCFEMLEPSILDKIAQTLDHVLKNLQPVCRLVDPSFTVSSKITDFIRPGKLSIIALEENSNKVMKTILAIYNNTAKKLPEPHQVLVCNQDTTWVEMQLLLHRCIRSDKENLFCVANVEMLPNEVQFQLVEALHKLHTSQTFLLAIICCGIDNHPFVNEFSGSVLPVHPLSDTAFTNILQNTWPDVCSITSDVPGLGKTETIKRRSRKQGKGVVTFHISGPLNKAKLVERLANLGVRSHHILHIDIGNIENPMELDAFLFEIIILGFASAGRSYVRLPTKQIFIEIANTINHHLKDALQTAMSFKRENLSWQDYTDLIVSININSPIQVVCHYLNILDDGTVDSRDIYFTGKKAVSPLPAQKCQHLLRKYFPGTGDMSFNMARVFINVLADQLKKMSCSTFFRTQNLQAALGDEQGITVKSNLLYALLNTSSEFASRSVNNCRKVQTSAVKSDSKSQSSSVEPSNNSNENSLIRRVEGMIRWEDTNHLIFVFHNQDIQTLSAMYRDKSKVPSHIKNLFESQDKEVLPDFKFKTAAELQDILQRVARTNPAPLAPKKLEDMAKDYALTPDNLLKMVLIMLRIKAHIPVLIMGETGCGKTSLIRYLSQICEVSFRVVQIHAGVEEEHILERIHQISREAEKNIADPVWLFLDEINTCNHLGLISNILCHHKCLSKTLPPNLFVMAACNPYKLRPEKKVLTAGLQGKIKFDEMSRLVYRVFPLPETMVDYVWDFGSISEKDEEAYVHRMNQNVFVQNQKMNVLLADLLIMSQRVVREIEESESCVSLRDVNRCKLLAKWFQGFLKKKKGSVYYSVRDFQIRCMILALAHCYHSRLAYAQDRKKYRKGMAAVIHSHEIVGYTEDKILDIITEEQRDILKQMELPAGTAHNTALQENVFVILVCILNRIPIFVVGKPGCSKSLSMQVIRSNLRGKDSKKKLFKLLPQLNCVSFQGSESSTSDGIIKVFQKAQRYQENNDPEEDLSVVILDEIGLAEISKFNPLKVLHSLLEPEGKQFPDVAVVGISNWALDAAKMNRAIHLSRPEMDEEELYMTGKSISKSMEKKLEDSDHFFKRKRSKTVKAVEMDKELKSLAASYMKYVEKQTFANFHGLRDYYSLVKYIARRLSEMPSQEITDAKKMDVITRGLQRNFGGQHSEFSTLHELFKANLQSLEDHRVPVIELITENIQDKMARHLMLITSGDAALDIVEQQLDKLGKGRITIYGSQFEEDLTDDYNYRILNRIIICMEQGLVLILKDLDSIYGSLYDMLNQNYTVVGEKKNCRVALGPYSNPMCQVHDDFRCIVLVDESKIDHADPPFLNRFEKQNLKFTDILSKIEHSIISDLENWVKYLTDVPSKHFETVDIFPIYSSDMIPSLVHICLVEMDKDGIHDIDDKFPGELTSLCKQRLLWIMKPESVLRLGSSEFGRNPKNAKELKYITKDYLKLPIHGGLERYLHSEINKVNEESENRMFMIFSNSNIHTNVQAILSDIKCQVDKLGAFRSEKQLTNRMQQFWSEPDPKLLVLQCKPSDDEAHILLARNVIERTRNEYLKEPDASIKHVCMIMHLDRMKSGSRAVPQINFLTEWKLVMLDSLEEPRMPLTEAVGKSLVETIEQRRPLCTYIQEQLFWAFTRIQYAEGGRDIHSIDLVIKQIQSSEDFLKILDEAIFKWIQEQQENIDVKNWQVEVACDTHALYSSSSFSCALENYISQVINDPLARILFELEKLDALSAFFQEDASADVQSMWKDLFNDPKLFSIQNTPKPTDAECFACLNPILQFKLPFFKIVYEQIETTKSSFLELVQTVKSATGIEDVHEIPDIYWKELLLHQENIIAQEVPELEKITYSTWLEDYQNDFFHVTSYQIARGLSSQQRALAMKWCLFGEVELWDIHASAVITNLHAAYWIHFGLFQSELQLLDMCKEVLEEKGGIACFIQSFSKDSNIVGSLAFGTIDQEYPNLTEDDKVSTSNEILTADVVQERDDILDSASAMEINIGSSMHDASVEKPNDKIPLPKAEVSKSPDQEKKKRRELLVEELCKMLLPSNATLSRYSDVHVWHQRVTSVLAIANQVSMDPSVLYALRLCCDVAVQMVLLQPTEKNRLEQLGSLLQNDLPLDSEKIRDFMRDMIETNKNTHKDNSQRLIAAYCSRCIGANPDTEIISWLMDLISDQALPDNMLTNLKPPIHHALHTELGLDGDIFFKLLENDDSSLKIMEESPFLSAMDACLRRLYDSGLVDSPFPALLIDILDQDIMRERITNTIAEASATTDPQVHYFLRADKILQSGAFSFRHVTAIAYIRSFMTVLSMHLEKRNHDTSESQVVVQTVNAVLSQNDEWIKSLQVFLLKCLGNEKWIFQLQRICKKLSDHLKCYEEDKWQKDFDLKYVEMSPISYHISKSISAATFDAAKDKESVKTLVQRAMSSTEEMMCLNNEVMRHFYMKRLISELNDTDKTRCKMIVNCAKEMKMEKKVQSVLECFCGTRDFQVKMLQLHEESSSIHKDLASCVCHLIVVLTGYGCDAGKPVSLFAKSLLDPVCLTELFLPGMPETVEEQFSCIPSACLTSEDKSFRVLREGNIVDLHISALCKLDLKVKYMPCKGYCIQDTSKFEEIAFGSRKISSLSSTILHILLHGCLLGSVAVGFATVDDIHILLDEKIETEDIVCFLVQAMEMELRFLSSYLGLQQQDTVVFLHCVLYQTKALLCADKRCMASEAERAEWEKKFSKQVDILVVDRFAKILDLRREQNAMYDLPLDALENLIQEVDEIKLEDRTQTMPSLWRSTVAPSFESLVAELGQRKEDFPFLQLVLNNLQGIKLMKHIGPILQWHLTCFANVSFTMKKREAEEMTISDFLHKESDEKRRQLIRDKFEQFKKSWDDIMENKEALQKFDPEFPSLEHVHGQLQLKYCLYEGPHSTISRVLTTLVCMQNRLIDETLKIAGKMKPMSLSFLRRGEEAMIWCTSLTDLTSRDIVNFEWDDSFLKYSQNNVQYGYGRQIIYDFEKIEAEVASEILTNVKYLLMEDSLPRIIYADELFQNYVAMIKQIQKNIEQEPLPSDLVLAISKKKERDPRQILDFLTHLGMILSLLKKTSGKPDSSLVDYVDDLKNILTRPFPKTLLPSPENSIRLCHLVSLHELLEELNADSIIDSLDDTFRVKLSSLTQRKVSDLMSKNPRLAELTLKAVKRFVHRCLSSLNVDISQSMINYLCEDSFWPVGMMSDGVLKHGDLIQDLRSLFPEDVTVQNVHPFFQLLNSKVEENKKKDQRVTMMVQSFPTQTKAQGTQSSRKRAAKGYSKT